MPPAQDGPDRSPLLGAALRSLRDGARDGADEVLSHLPELGDRELQSALDAYLDQVADLLREVDASASELADRLDIAGAGILGAAGAGRAGLPGTRRVRQ